MLSRSSALPMCLYIYNNHTLHAIISTFVPCSTLFQATGAAKRRKENPRSQGRSVYTEMVCFNKWNFSHTLGWVGTIPLNGKYAQHSAAIAKSGSINEVETGFLHFNPWQYDNLGCGWKINLLSYVIVYFNILKSYVHILLQQILRIHTRFTCLLLHCNNFCLKYKFSTIYTQLQHSHVPM